MDTEVISRLAALGISTEHVAVEGNIVRVDEDVIFERDELLAGVYGPAYDDQPIDKGYLIKPGIVTDALPPNPANVTNIKLVFDTGVPQNVRDAFINAAGDFNSTAGSTARFSQNNTGPTLTIKWMTGLWPTATTCSSASVACTRWPLNGMPGTTIYVKGYAIDPNCGWTTSALAYTARHEMMHALGMMHPKDGFGDHITTTAACAGSTSTCPQNPGYSTIMIAKMAFSASCTVAPTLLQTDDKASLAKLY